MKRKILSLMMILSLLLSSMGTIIYAEGNPVLTVGAEYKVSEYETYLDFVPEESGFYFIYSTGEEDTYAYIMNNSTYEYLAYDNLSGKGENFRISVYLEAGESYEVYVRIYGSPANFDVGVIASPAIPEAVLYENTVHAVTDCWDFLSFVPTKDGTYRFFSVEEDGKDESYWGIIYNSDFEQISVENGDLYSYNNFYVECDMVAGETYYLETVANDEYGDISYSVQISEISPITSLEIVPLDGTVAGVNGDLHCDLIIEPENHKSQEIEWYIEPERVGRIEYGDNRGASIELHSPGIAKVTAVTYSDGVAVSDSYMIECTGELSELSEGVTYTDYMYDWDIHSYTFTAEEEGQYGILSRGDLDTTVYLYRPGDTTPWKSETRKGAGENFNIQFYNLDPGTEYIVEVRVENDDEYTTVSGDYEIMAYKATDEIEALVMSVDDSCTVYTNVDYYEFSVSLLPETANQEALEWVTWTLDGDDIGMNTLYARNYVYYKFYSPGTATLTASISEANAGKDLLDTCVIESCEAGYKTILLDEVKTVRTEGHYSDGWFCFIPEEDGLYTFYSTGDADIDVNLYTYDEKYGYCEYYDYDSGYFNNFLCTVELCAGQEITIECRVYNTQAVDQYCVSVCREYYADSVTIVPNELNVYEVGETASFYAMMGNGGATYYDHGLLQWSISNPDVAYISGGYNDLLDICFIGEGITTVDIVTAEGYHDSITLYVGVEPPVNPPEEVIPGDVDGDGDVSPEDSYYIRVFIVNFVVSGDYDESADLNDDGKVTAVDSLLLKKMIAGVI